MVLVSADDVSLPVLNLLDVADLTSTTFHVGMILLLVLAVVGQDGAAMAPRTVCLHFYRLSVLSASQPALAFILLPYLPQPQPQS